MSDLAIVSFGRDSYEEARALPLLERFMQRYPGRVEHMTWWERRQLDRRLRAWSARRGPSERALFTAKIETHPR